MLPITPVATQLRAHLRALCNCSAWDDKWPELKLSVPSQGKSDTKQRAGSAAGAGEAFPLSPSSTALPEPTDPVAVDPHDTRHPSSPAGVTASPEGPATLPAVNEVQRLIRAINGELDALPARAEAAKDQISSLEKQAVAAIRARAKQMSAEVSSAAKAKTRALQAELDKASAALQQLTREADVAQTSAATLDDEALVTSHAQLQTRLEDAFTALRALGFIPNTDATLHIATGGDGHVDRVVVALGTVVTEGGSQLASGASPTSVPSAAGANPAVTDGISASLNGLGSVELVAALVRQAASASVTVAVCAALRRSVAADPTVSTAVVKAGGIPALSRVLARHVTTAAVTEIACGALLQVVTAAAAAPASLGLALEPLVAAISIHSASPGIVVPACMLLRYALPDADDVPPAGAAAGALDHGSGMPSAIIATLVGLLTSSSTSDAVVEHALLALGSITARYAQLQPSLAKSRGVEAVLRVLAEKRSVAILTAACIALGAAAIGSEGKAAALSGGGVSAVISVLKEHADLPDVVAAACGALARVAGGSAEARAALGSSGSIDLLCAVLVSHARNRLVVEAVCRALWHATANSPGNKAAMVSAGAIPRLVAVLSEHVDSVAALGAACGTLRNATSNSPEAVSLVLRAAGLQSLKAAIAACPSAEQVLEQVRTSVPCVRGESLE